MNYRPVFLILGLMLSAASKWIQWSRSSLLGDLLILPAAIFFVLAVLLSIPTFQAALNHPHTKRQAAWLAVSSSLTVLVFQLFTLLTFGYEQPAGYFFIFPAVGSALWSLFLYNRIKRDHS